MATLILDTGAALNLLATGRTQEIASTVGVRLALASRAVEDCATLQDPGGQAIPSRIDDALAAASVELVDLAAEELSMFVGLAPRVGDNEAATLAIARNRRFAVLTDDAVVRRAAAAFEHPVKTRTTGELMRAWSRTAPGRDVIDALTRIETLAAFRPREDDPCADWWRQQLSEQAA